LCAAPRNPQHAFDEAAAASDLSGLTKERVRYWRERFQQERLGIFSRSLLNEMQTSSVPEARGHNSTTAESTQAGVDVSKKRKKRNPKAKSELGKQTKQRYTSQSRRPKNSSLAKKAEGNQQSRPKRQKRRRPRKQNGEGNPNLNGYDEQK
jgi:hypothetical protein